MKLCSCHSEPFGFSLKINSAQRSRRTSCDVRSLSGKNPHVLVDIGRAPARRPSPQSRGTAPRRAGRLERVDAARRRGRCRRRRAQTRVRAPKYRRGAKRRDFWRRHPRRGHSAESCFPTDRRRHGDGLGTCRRSPAGGLVDRGQSRPGGLGAYHPPAFCRGRRAARILQGFHFRRRAFLHQRRRGH